MFGIISYTSRTVRGQYNGQRSNIYYTHWLPKDLKRLLPQEPPDDQNLQPDFLSKFYQKFDTLLHVTTCKNAALILKTGFRPTSVRSNSVVNSETELLVKMESIEPRPLHPLRESKVIWYGAGNTSDLRNPEFTVVRYGNVVFSMQRLDGFEGIFRIGLKFYFIEVIEYVKKSACRILVSHRDYPLLRPFDPELIGSPLYIKRGQLYYNSLLKRSDGIICENDLEIMKEETDYRFQKDYDLNHCVSFCKCTDERYDIIGKENPSLSDLVPYYLKLAIVLACGESKYRDRLSLQTPFEKREERDKELKSELERVHNEAVQKWQRMEEEELDIEKIKQAIQNDTSVVERLMGRVDIVDSYLDLLKQFPEGSRTNLKDTLWEEIVKVLS